KQYLGLQDPQYQAERAVTRTAPVVALRSALVGLWYVAEVRHGATPRWPERPWYRAKAPPSFLEMLTALRCADWHDAILHRPSPARRIQSPYLAWLDTLLATA